MRADSWRVTGAVLLAHVCVAWLLSQTLVSSISMGEPDNVIMASVVMDTPAPPAPQPQPPKPQAQPEPKPLPQPKVTPQLHPTPVVSSTAPSETAPVVPAPPSSPATAAAAASSTQRPSTSAPTVTLPSTNADYLNNPAPPYPRMSRRMGEQGTVLIRVFINTEGRAEKAEIRTSSGYARLDDTALETVKRWRYVPGTRAGVAEAMWFNVPIRFVLD
ncbi:energy transducer TonB [Limnohabitans sp.]|uniref:energy transducer TonB n=1 Tax=Limnohabitans sp. TaxID=1907725 RepID=UPI0031200B4E